MKILIVGADLFHEYEKTGEKTSMTKLFIILQTRLKTKKNILQGGSNMTGTDLYVNKPHGAEAVRP